MEAAALGTRRDTCTHKRAEQTMEKDKKINKIIFNKKISYYAFDLSKRVCVYVCVCTHTHVCNWGLLLPALGRVVLLELGAANPRPQQCSQGSEIFPEQSLNFMVTCHDADFSCASACPRTRTSTSGAREAHSLSPNIRVCVHNPICAPCRSRDTPACCLRQGPTVGLRREPDNRGGRAEWPQGRGLVARVSLPHAHCLQTHCRAL